MSILVTGGTGFIGSHTCVELLEKGHEVVVVDNLSNSEYQTLSGIKKITHKSLLFKEIDLLDYYTMKKLFNDIRFDAVIHFAGFKSVNESIELPLRYYFNNVQSSQILFDLMHEFDIKNIIFSSSATVYGEPEEMPIKESFPTTALNPYAKSKLFIEKNLRNLYRADPTWNIILLRYFNPIGAHHSGLIGEQPKGETNNLMPYILKAAAKEIDYLQIFGGDYPTNDGTGVRDYIHVSDLAVAHSASLDLMLNNKPTSKSVKTINLGTGIGYSVLEIIQTFEESNNVKVPYKIVDRRSGDIAESYTDPTLAKEILGWETKKNLHDMCIDSWNWKQNYQCSRD